MDNSKNAVITAKKAAAAAGATTVYEVVPNRPFMVHGYSWMYETEEANADNTLDFAVDYTTDGAAFTDIKTNGNANGLKDTGEELLVFDRRADAASGGAAALATDTDFGPVRVPANAVIRFVITTAGTGTVPAINLNLYGAYV